MRIVITGASGQVGAALRALDWSATDSVVAIDEAEVDLSGPPSSIEAAIEELRPDVIINTAAYTAVDRAEDEPGLAFAVNATAVAALAAVANRHNAFLVHYSTDYVFDGSTPDGFFDEDTQPRPLNVYGASKYAGELAAQCARRSTTIRTSWVYSATGRNFVRTMWSLATQKEELSVVDDQFGRLTSADQLALATQRLLALAGREDLPRTVHLTGDGPVSTWFDIAKRVVTYRCRLEGRPVPRLHRVSTEAYGAKASRPRHSTLRLDRAHSLGIEPGGWEPELERTLDILRGQVG